MSRVTLIVIGLIVGAAIGWFTAPRPSVDIQVGGLSVQVQGNKAGGSVSANGSGDGVQVAVGDRSSALLSDPTSRTVIFALIGGVVGLVISAFGGRRKTV